MNINNNWKTKQNAKKLEKVNLILEKWSCIKSFFEILLPFAELTKTFRDINI